MPPPLTINGTANAASPFLSINGGTSSIPAQPTFFDKAVGVVKNYAVDSFNQSKNFLDKITTQNPVDTVFNAGKGIVNDFKQPFDQGVQKITEGLSQAIPNIKLNPLNPTGMVDLVNPNTVAGILKVISGVAQSALSPITGGFHVASQIPGIKQVTDAINIPFTATGFAGSWASGKAIDWIPDAILSPESKNIIKQPIQDFSSLAAQTVFGGVIMDKIEGYVSKGETITPETAKKIVDETKVETQDHHAFQSEGLVPPKLEVNTPQDSGRYSTVHEGGVVKTVDGTPVKIVDGVETFTHKDENGNWVVSEVSTGRSLSGGGYPTQKHAIDATRNLIDVKGVPEVQRQIAKMGTLNKENTLQSSSPIEPNMKIARVSKASSDINTSLVEKGFEAMKPETLATYDPITKKDQIQRVSDLMSRDMEGAKGMATGKKPIEAGVHPQVLFNAIEADALKNNDITLLQKLAKSPLSAQLSEAGQTLGAHGFNDNPSSPVRAIQDVIKAREERATPKARKTVVDEVSSEIKKSAPTKQTWSDFVEQIKCNY